MLFSHQRHSAKYGHVRESVRTKLLIILILFAVVKHIKLSENASYMY